MTTLRQNAIMMIQSLPENQLVFIMNMMKELSHLIPKDGKIPEVGHNDLREQAFSVLENMRRRIPDLNYGKELAEYREEKYL